MKPTEADVCRQKSSSIQSNESIVLENLISLEYVFDIKMGKGHVRKGHHFQTQKCFVETLIMQRYYRDSNSCDSQTMTDRITVSSYKCKSLGEWTLCCIDAQKVMLESKKLLHTIVCACGQELDF